MTDLTAAALGVRFCAPGALLETERVVPVTEPAVTALLELSVELLRTPGDTKTLAALRAVLNHLGIGDKEIDAPVPLAGLEASHEELISRAHAAAREKFKDYREVAAALTEA